MAGRWTTISLAEAVNFASGGTPSTTEPSFWNGSIPWVSAKDMKHLILYDTEDHLTEEGARSGTRVVPEGTVLLLTRGMTLLKDVPISVIRRPMAFNQDVKAVRPRAGIAAEYLPYLVLSLKPRLLNLVDLAGHGTGRLNLDELKSLEVPLPPAGEQRAIGQILGALDARIELNWRMNQTLEAIAGALFKSWFVDFDPVRAKVGGREPGLPRPLADLFPEAFVTSEMGEIPAGWEVTSIGELATIVGGSTPSTKEPAFWEGGLHHWATPKDLANIREPVLLETERKITDLGLAQIGSGLLPVGTVLLSSRAPIGYLAIAEVPVAINQGFIAMKPREGVSNLFLLLWAGWANKQILSRANGSTFLEISKANFRPISLVRAPHFIIEAFERLSRPFYRRVASNARESRTVLALRDTLLPKLVSGELRIKDAEHLIGLHT
jgi:type I restriction enzyme S subunit